MTVGLSLLCTFAAGIVGFILGMLLNQPLDGAILGALIAGIGCIVAAINDLKQPLEEAEEKNNKNNV